MIERLCVHFLEKENEIIKLRLSTDEEIKLFENMDEVKKHVIASIKIVYGDKPNNFLIETLTEMIELRLQMDSKESESNCIDYASDDIFYIDCDEVFIRYCDLVRLYDDYHITRGIF